MTLAHEVSPSVPARTPPKFRTAADWLESLGNVPAKRIVFDPLPGTATEADVIRLDDHEDRLCELIDGTLVEKTVGQVESAIAARIIYFLSLIIIPQKLGVVAGEAGMIRMFNGRIRMPDVGYFPFARLPGGRHPKEAAPAIVPDLAVEVLSESNTRREMEIKLAEYFEAGTRLVWYVDPRTQTVDVYTSPTAVTRLAATDRITGGEVLPTFEVTVADFFEGTGV